MSNVLNKSRLIFRQLFHPETSTYTYLLGCPTTREAIVIDPVIDCVERDLKIADDLGLRLTYGLNTHVHADHTTGTGVMKSALKNFKSVLGEKSGGLADIYISDQEKFPFGKLTLECRSTPGHTSGCMTYVLHEQEMAFTGDTLLIRGCGRTDFQQGSASTMYDSVHSKIFSLPASYMLYPCHDYKGFTVTTVDEELKFNERLTKSKDEFIAIMKNLKLAKPARMEKAIPENLKCGIID